MNEKEQKRFARELCDSIKKEVLEKINAGKIPDSWDGIELRWYFAKRFEEATLSTRGNSSYRRRFRDFKNHVLVTNL